MLFLSEAEESGGRLLDLLDVFAGFGSLAVAGLALAVALRAQKSADTAITDERRRVFELEILRDLMKDLEETEIVAEAFRGPGTLSRYRRRLDLLSTRLPTWDRVMGLRDLAAVVAEMQMGDEHRTQQQLARDLNTQRAAVVQKSIKAQERWMWPAREDKQRPTAERQRDWEILQQQASRLNERETEANEEQLRIEREAKDKLEEKLTYDVQQAIWARVEARKKWPIPWMNRNV